MNLKKLIIKDNYVIMNIVLGLLNLAVCFDGGSMFNAFAAGVCLTMAWHRAQHLKQVKIIDGLHELLADIFEVIYESHEGDKDSKK